MKRVRNWLMIGLAASLAACCTRPAPPPEVIDLGCYTYGPIYPTLQDTKAISPQLVKQLLTHNEKYKRNCIEKKEGAP